MVTNCVQQTNVLTIYQALNHTGSINLPIFSYGKSRNRFLLQKFYFFQINASQKQSHRPIYISLKLIMYCLFSFEKDFIDGNVQIEFQQPTSLKAYMNTNIFFSRFK